MSLPVTRRTFLGASGLAAATVALPSTSSAILHRGTSRPAAVSSGNGLRAVNRAMELMLGGTDTLDAAIEGVKIQELDPNDNSVGYGGLPNEDGVVQLDASCMHGLTRRAGAVAALEGTRRRARWPGWCSSIPTTSCWSARAPSDLRSSTASRRKTC